jgi:hypothetical protein
MNWERSHIHSAQSDDKLSIDANAEDSSLVQKVGGGNAHTINRTATVVLGSTQQPTAPRWSFFNTRFSRKKKTFLWIWNSGWKGSTSSSPFRRVLAHYGIKTQERSIARKIKLKKRRIYWLPRSALSKVANNLVLPAILTDRLKEKSILMAGGLSFWNLPKTGFPHIPSCPSDWIRRQAMHKHRVFFGWWKIVSITEGISYRKNSWSFYHACLNESEHKLFWGENSQYQ